MKICKTISNLIMIIAFFLVLIFPPVYFEKVKDTIPQDTSENRKLAEKPEFDSSTIISYSDDYESYYNDNLPFRGIIRTLWTKFNFYILNESTTTQVLVGKNEGSKESTWLFYQENHDGNPIKEVQGVYDFTAEEVFQIEDAIDKNMEELAKRNIEVYYTFIPNKATLYKEKLPDNITIFDQDTRVDRLIKYLEDKNTKNIINLKNYLLEAKKNGQVYHKQDTHWNEFGAFVGYKAISQTIAKDSEINYNFEVQFPEEKLSDLDLIQMSGIKDVLKDVEPKVIYQEDVEFTGMVLQTENEIAITECETAPVDKTIMIVGDSFRKAMIPYFAKNFKKVIFLHRCDYGPYMLDAYAPDIIVCQFLERYVNTLAEFKLY